MGQSISSLAAIKNRKEEGLGAGGKSMPPIFAGKRVTTPGTLTKINALVNEYINVVTQVRRRWPMGLGKYLLMKTEESMQGKSVLQVDKLSDHAGNFVFVNGRAVGLSNRLNDFEKLASVSTSTRLRSLPSLLRWPRSMPRRVLRSTMS